MSRWKIKRSRKSEQKKRDRPEQRARPEQKDRLSATSISMGTPGSPFGTTIKQVSPADIPALARYFKAHKLLPRNYIFDARESKYRRIVAMAVELLQDPGAKKKERIRAIVILGHSPAPLAIDALEELAGSNHPQADLARMALDECLTLAEQYLADHAGQSGSPVASKMS